MRKFFAIACGLFGSWISISGALAQTEPYMAQPPGRPPTYLTPRAGGGYIINTPGRPPTYVNPRLGGGYIIERPGQVPTVVNPQPGGGLVVETPGYVPTYLGSVPGGTPGLTSPCGINQTNCNTGARGTDQRSTPPVPPTAPQN